MVNIGSGNGPVPYRHKAMITWTNDDRLHICASPGLNELNRAEQKYSSRLSFWFFVHMQCYTYSSIVCNPTSPALGPYIQCVPLLHFINMCLFSSGLQISIFGENQINTLGSWRLLGMPWLLVLPCHQQLRYWVSGNKPTTSLSSMRKDFN